jgi:hypothetical protein
MTIEYMMQISKRIKPIWLLPVVVFSFATQAMFLAAIAETAWISGHVISTSLNGQGYSSKATTSNNRRYDIWWNYCIASDDQIYSVISRENPMRTGLQEKSAINFMEKQNQIFMLNPAGKRVALKIIRKGRAIKCP